LYSSVLLELTACLHASAAYYSLLQFRYSAHLCRRSTDAYHRKHMSRDGCPASQMACWLLPTENTYHVTANYRCGDVIAPARKCLPSRCLEAGCITPLFYCCVLDRVCVCVCVMGVAWQRIYMSHYPMWSDEGCKTDKFIQMRFLIFSYILVCSKCIFVEHLPIRFIMYLSQSSRTNCRVATRNHFIQKLCIK
jgi:hypothetical protein